MKQETVEIKCNITLQVTDISAYTLRSELLQKIREQMNMEAGSKPKGPNYQN